MPSEYPWDPTAERKDGSIERPTLGIERKLDGRRRYCRFCGKFKPDRTHHCRVMGRCVLEMDHFCPWVNNTIGFFNHKYFVQLLLYGTSGLVTYDVLMFNRFREAVSHTLTPVDAVTVLVWFFCAAFYYRGVLVFLLSHVLDPVWIHHDRVLREVSRPCR